LSSAPNKIRHAPFGAACIFKGDLMPPVSGAGEQGLAIEDAIRRPHLLNNPMISAFAKVLKCKLKPTTAADVSGFTPSRSIFTAKTVKR
jgi:hypothetical protein